MTEKEHYDYLMQHLLLEFEYGSVVYGTLTEQSDRDIICIVTADCDLSDATNGIWEYRDGQTDYQFINETTWIDIIRNHGIQWLECYSLPEKHVLFGSPRDWDKYFTLDKWRIRQVMGQIASNAWAKAHKKMTVEKDYDLYRGQKSLFHAIRILKFARQYGEYGRIVDFHEVTPFWTGIYTMGACGWDVYKELWQPVYKQAHSEMVKVCPKPPEFWKDADKLRAQGKLKVTQI